MFEKHLLDTQEKLLKMSIEMHSDYNDNGFKLP